jgi:hypothetical protein
MQSHCKICKKIKLVPRMTKPEHREGYEKFVRQFNTGCCGGKRTE